MSKFLDDERKANLERLPLLKSALKDVQAARNCPLAPRMERVRRLVELMSYAKTFAGLGDVEAALPKSQFPVQTGDDCKDAATVSEAAQKRYEKAIRAYTEDGRNGVFWRINGVYRKLNKKDCSFDEKRLVLLGMDEEAKAVDDELEELFGLRGRIKAPVRVYRGIAPKDAKSIAGEKLHIENAYWSTSTSFSIALDYAMKKGCGNDDAEKNGAVLVIDLPSEFPAISLEDRSEKPYEKEVLLRKWGMYKKYDGYRIAETAFGKFRVFHLQGVPT